MFKYLWISAATLRRIYGQNNPYVGTASFLMRASTVAAGVVTLILLARSFVSVPIEVVVVAAGVAVGALIAHGAVRNAMETWRDDR